MQYECGFFLFIALPPPPQPPKFTTLLQHKTAYDAEEVQLTCTVTGNPQPELAWFHNDKSIDKSEDFVITYNKKTGKCELLIVECLPDDKGTFKCVASNSAGQAVTNCVLQVVEKPAPSPAPEPMDEMAIVPEQVKRAEIAPPVKEPPPPEPEPQVR